MNRQAIRGFVRRRLDDLLAGSGQTWSDTDLNDEINEAIIEMALDVEFHGLLWRMAKRKTFSSIVSGTLEYALASDFFISRKVIRTDTVNPVPCTKLDVDELEEYSRTDGLNSEGGLLYAIGPDANGAMALLLPVSPHNGVTLVQHYMRTPMQLNHDTSDVDPNIATPTDIPIDLHRGIALIVAMNLLGPDQAGGSSAQAISVELQRLLEKSTRLLRRDYSEQYVRDVMGE